MVGPGEVDEELQPEVVEECAKYGEVVKVIIYEVSFIVLFTRNFSLHCQYIIKQTCNENGKIHELNSQIETVETFLGRKFRFK